MSTFTIVPTSHIGAYVTVRNAALGCTVSCNAGAKYPKLTVCNSTEIDEVVSTRFELAKNCQEKYNIKYEFTSLPTVGTAPEWTGRIDVEDWKKVNNMKIALHETFTLYFRAVEVHKSTTWYLIDIDCTDVLAVLQ